MSWMSPRDLEREKLEGSLLTVCTDCKDMVLQASELGFFIYFSIHICRYLRIDLDEGFEGI